MLYDDASQLGESPGLDQNELTTAKTAVILWISQRPSFALKSNAMAHCALAVCTAVKGCARHMEAH